MPVFVICTFCFPTSQKSVHGERLFARRTAARRGDRDLAGGRSGWNSRGNLNSGVHGEGGGNPTEGHFGGGRKSVALDLDLGTNRAAGRTKGTDHRVEVDGPDVAAAVVGKPDVCVRADRHSQHRKGGAGRQIPHGHCAGWSNASNLAGESSKVQVSIP